jgi:hypothetical protein
MVSTEGPEAPPDGCSTHRASVLPAIVGSPDPPTIPPLPAHFNFRDLGGLETVAELRTRKGRLFRGARFGSIEAYSEAAGVPVETTREALFFEDLRLPSAALLGEVDGGFTAMMKRLAQERLHSAVGNLAHAHARAALASTLVYVKDRRAFGRPIGSFQSNRFLLAELTTELDVSQAFVDRCVSLHVEHALSPVDAAKAKWWSSEVQNRIIDACVQLHGGYGYMVEYDVTRAWLDARVSKIWAGTNEIMKETIGRDLGLADPKPAG